jgi:hypothetical protein
LKSFYKAKIRNLFVAINPLNCRICTPGGNKTAGRFVLQKQCAMERYTLQNDVKTFGFPVPTFPLGIGEAFEKLLKMVPGGFNRSYFGISYMNKSGQMIYNATALETYEGEGDQYQCKTYIIGKGEYITKTLHDWRKNTVCIKDVFRDIMQDALADTSKPAIEWYKNEDEMLCMLQEVTSGQEAKVTH